MGGSEPGIPSCAGWAVGMWQLDTGAGQAVGAGQRDTGKGGAKESLPTRKHMDLGEPSCLLTTYLGNPTTICVSVPVC